MMRIVKQEQVIMALAMRCDAARQRRRVPLVNQNQIGPGQGVVEIERTFGKRRDIQQRISGTELLGVIAALGSDQVRIAPGILRFKNLYVVPASGELCHYAPQKVRIAMVPARTQRMAEERNPHQLALRSGGP